MAGTHVNDDEFTMLVEAHAHGEASPSDVAVLEAEQRRWIEANEAARRTDRTRDAERSMAELLEETARLSEVVSELRENIVRPPDVRPI